MQKIVAAKLRRTLPAASQHRNPLSTPADVQNFVVCPGDGASHARFLVAQDSRENKPPRLAQRGQDFNQQLAEKIRRHYIDSARKLPPAYISDLKFYVADLVQFGVLFCRRNRHRVVVESDDAFGAKYFCGERENSSAGSEID